MALAWSILTEVRSGRRPASAWQTGRMADRFMSVFTDEVRAAVRRHQRVALGSKYKSESAQADRIAAMVLSDIGRALDRAEAAVASPKIQKSAHGPHGSVAVDPGGDAGTGDDTTGSPAAASRGGSPSAAEGTDGAAPIPVADEPVSGSEDTARDAGVAR